MGTNLQEDPRAIREVPSHNLKVGVSPTISAQRITVPRICYEIENSEFYAHQSVHRKSLFKNVPTR
jgi:hypothetical protein